jgi:hypothetical protein
LTKADRGGDVQELQNIKTAIPVFVFAKYEGGFLSRSATTLE